MKLSFSTRGWWQEGWEELVSTATEMRFQGIEIYNVLRHSELIGKGGKYHDIYGQKVSDAIQQRFKNQSNLQAERRSTAHRAIYSPQGDLITRLCSSAANLALNASLPLRTSVFSSLLAL